MQNITKRLALFAASAGVALAGLGVLGTAANAATDLPPGPTHPAATADFPPGPGLSVADYPPGPGLSVADFPPGPGITGPEI
jgi:hypothetical protein